MGRTVDAVCDSAGRSHSNCMSIILFCIVPTYVFDYTIFIYMSLLSIPVTI